MRILWLRDRNKFPVACVASEVAGQIMAIGISVFNKHDTFDKKRGREIAVGRLRVTLEGKATDPYHQRIDRPISSPKTRLLSYLAADFRLPWKLQTAAREELNRELEKASG